jgi:hypothetical protein
MYRLRKPGKWWSCEYGGGGGHRVTANHNAFLHRAAQISKVQHRAKRNRAQYSAPQHRAARKQPKIDQRLEPLHGTSKRTKRHCLEVCQGDAHNQEHRHRDQQGAWLQTSGIQHAHAHAQHMTLSNGSMHLADHGGTRGGRRAPQYPPPHPIPATYYPSSLTLHSSLLTGHPSPNLSHKP